AACAGPTDRWSVGRRDESGRRGPPVLLVRRGRDHFGLIQSISAAVVADVEQCHAVHGLYYLLMHGWFQIFPPTEFWSRAPSGVGVGAAAAGVVVLGKQFSSRTVALLRGCLRDNARATWA